MKKTKTFLVAVLTAVVLIIPSLSGINQASAYYEEDSYDYEDNDVLTAVAVGTAAAGIIEKLFCPKTPQNRCKGGVCKPGACISFRSACEGTGSC